MSDDGRNELEPFTTPYLNDWKWPDPASRSAAHSTRPRPICSYRYGGDTRHSETRNISILNKYWNRPTAACLNLIMIVQQFTLRP